MKVSNERGEKEEGLRKTAKHLSHVSSSSPFLTVIVDSNSKSSRRQHSSTSHTENISPSSSLSTTTSSPPSSSLTGEVGDPFFSLSSSSSFPSRLCVDIETGSFLEEGALEVRPSLIPSAGLGLFATQFIPEGVWVCEYLGRQLSLREVLREKDRTYVICAGSVNRHIDAKSYLRVYARYINDHFDHSCLNAAFVKRKAEGFVLSGVSLSSS
ncbi:histone lysine set [Cystoisospora suis]|uniref:Histone lysine set n=1 Tax=Cystoisospora suis TaxID=483139 RepID=A0A2C6JLE3_9APIC|nr:histone lysine set [Cystoisospora suis]